MKTLKSKLKKAALIGAIGLTGFGDLKNSYGQALNETTIFECYDENINKIPCFKEDKNYWLIESSLEYRFSSSVVIDYSVKCVEIDYGINKNNGNLGIAMKNYMQIEDFRGKYLEYSKKYIDETFNIDFNSGLIDYSKVSIVDSTPPRFEKEYEYIDLTKQDICEIFDESFAERIKEIINARKDSLELVNLMKKEFNRWKIIEDEKGNRFEITPLDTLKQ